MSIILYHNPRCSKSRQALSLLRGTGLPFEVVEYLKSPLSCQQLDRLCRQLSLEPSEIVRQKDKAFGIFVDQMTGATRQGWLNFLAEHPELMQRPIVVRDDTAVIGRPTENIEQLL